MSSHQKTTAHSHASEHDSRDALLQAAKKVFAAKGFDGATVKDLAEAANVNVSLVSYYFNGKEGLYLACLEQFGRSRLVAAEHILKKPTSPEDLRVRLTLFVEEFILRHLEESDVSTIMHRECGNKNSITQELFKNVFLKLFQTLITFLKSAQSAGLLRKDLEMEISGGLFIGGIIHLVRMNWVSEEFFKRSLNNIKQREIMIEHAVTQFLSGVTPPLSKVKHTKAGVSS